MEVCWFTWISALKNQIPFFFFLMIRPPPRSTLFPSPTLFRSGTLPQTVLELGSDLLPPLLEPVGRAVDHLVDLGDLLGLLGRHGESEVEGELGAIRRDRSEEHTSELQSQSNLVCRLLLEKKKD